MDRGVAWEQVYALLETARDEAPAWAPPQRLLDDLQTSLLSGPAVLREHWQALAREPGVGLHAYWLGRLLPGQGSAGFEQAVAHEPLDPWGWHGRAFEARQAGRNALALVWQRKAFELAREPYERNLFAMALARLLLDRGQPVEALKVLDQAEGASENEFEAIEARLQWIDLARKVPDPDVHELCLQRVRELLTDPRLSRRQVRNLVEWGLLASEETSALLLARPEEEARTLALRLLGEDGQNLLAAVDPNAVAHGILWQLSHGHVVEVLDHWWQRLPKFLQDESAPMEPWRRLRKAGQAWQVEPNADNARRLGESLLAAGWFSEATAWVRSMPAGLEVETALDFERRAALGGLVLDRFRVLFRDLDRGQARVSATELEPGHNVTDLDDLLKAVAQVLVQGGVLASDEIEGVVDSPRLRFAGFAQVVEPGPVVAPWDSAPAGTQVAGLAQALWRIGRVGVFGSALGVPPDGTILPYVTHSFVQGEHLGVAYRGTVLWCLGADVGARAVRQGASVAGAALHEGYYVDLEALQDSLERWRRFDERWSDPWVRERLVLALSDPGLPVEAAADLRGPRESLGATFVPGGEPWAAAEPVLGEADRVRLALLIERGEGGGLGQVTLDEVAEMTATHEEGHLCERTRFLPLYRHLGAVLAFAAAEGFSASGIQARLEYRAELVALCEVPEPRIVLAEILDLAQGSQTGLPHGPAYRELLSDLLEVLAKGYRARAAWAGDWQPSESHLLLHQLHRVPVLVLRGAALELARGKGLMGL